MKLRLTPRVALDLADIGDYIRERNPEAALRMRAAILESLQNLVLFPQVGPQTQSGLIIFPCPVWRRLLANGHTRL
jgi:plasmid stabilization system protein ParE